ncbi:MAG: hypothetical protein EP326_08700 [Deltaproteobacteria bacterium]|nr:MAG: hypothetical protein EP326_08700 [Deltaproteobacteria bacterium]TNF31108.1 MAG: hypothetical protein EP319_03120 [Deltaproteobacteria bacterium]
MFMSLNRKIFDFTLNTTDKIVQPILRDRTYLRMSSFQMNSLLHLQKLVEIQTTKVLKSMNIPTEKTLKGLYQTIYELENHKANCERKINMLELKIKDLETRVGNELPPTLKKRTLTPKRSSIKNHAPSN